MEYSSEWFIYQSIEETVMQVVFVLIAAIGASITTIVGILLFKFLVSFFKGKDVAKRVMESDLFARIWLWSSIVLFCAFYITTVVFIGRAIVH